MVHPPDSQPTPLSSPVQGDPEVPPPTTFPSSGYIFGKGHDFMDGFCADRFAEDRNVNIYYPFTSKDEWELGAFLTKANISMKLTDQFLSLGLVSPRCVILPGLLHLTNARYAILVSLSTLLRHSMVSLDSCQVGLSGFHKKSKFPAIL